MDKSYFPMLDSLGFILSPLYIFFFITILIYISKSIRVGFSSKSITVLFIYYYLFFIFGSFSSLVPNLPDTSLFADIISNNYFPPSQSLGVKLFYYATYPIRILSLFKVELFIIFQIFIFILSLMFIWKSWQIVLDKNGYERDMGLEIFLILTAIYPSFLLYIPTPLREFFVLFGFSIMIYGLIDRYYNNRGLIAISIGSIFLIFGRPQLIVIVIIFFALFQQNRWIKYTLIGGGLLFMPLIFTKLTSYTFTPEFFQYVRNVSNDRYGELTYGVVEWRTYFDIVKDIPALVFQFILSPIPIMHNINPLTLLAIFIDAIYSIFIYLAVVYAGIKVSKIYLFIFTSSAILFSIWEFHIGGAVRHRMPLVAIILPVASYGFLKLYQDIKGSKRWS